MGAWDYGVFDDDMACDFVVDLFESDDVAGYCEKEFDNAIGSVYLEYDLGIAAAVCGAVVDSVLNGTAYSLYIDPESDLAGEEQYMDWISSMRESSYLDAFKLLKDKAVRSLALLISENSELYGLWSENEELFPKWIEVYKEMIERLRA